MSAGPVKSVLRVPNTRPGQSQHAASNLLRIEQFTAREPFALLAPYLENFLYGFFKALILIPGGSNVRSVLEQPALLQAVTSNESVAGQALK